ncbi:MAG: glycosyl transferase [Candidatus Nomurabacteria bacterium]|jgi:glycosyltransferase involved in cell wall biosynthesis|nr:glycosyl transferase [Candidatus Nomurabacteria bacterium]
MKFSIIIPVLNEARWISNTLNAVLGQSYQDFEIIVVDNACTDNTVAIVQEFMKRDARIHLVHCPTRGLLHARNAGLRAAQGDIIVQLDADNIPQPDWLFNAAKHLEDKDIVGLAGIYDYYDASAWFRYSTLFVGFVMMPIGNLYVQKRKFGAFMIGGNAFIRKWVLEDMGGYDTTHTFCNEDLVTAREVAKRGQVKFCLDLTVQSSARRHKALGYFNVQSKYNIGTTALLLGRPIPRQPEEYDFPR